MQANLECHVYISDGQGALKLSDNPAGGNFADLNQVVPEVETVTSRVERVGNELTVVNYGAGTRNIEFGLSLCQ